MNVYKVVQKFLDSRGLKPKLVGALVGGSYARGEATPQSDIDILLIYKDKYEKDFKEIQSQSTVYKKIPMTLIFESTKNIRFYLKNPDPSIISFLRENIIIYDPEKKLVDWTKKAMSLKIFKNKGDIKESERRLKERIADNIRRIELALKKKDVFSAIYILRGALDEVVEKSRMYEGDWLYSQRKSHLKFIRSQRCKNTLKKLFYRVNLPLSQKKIESALFLLTKYLKIKS